MLTREEALKILNLSSDATEEEIEKAYPRMVRRYPPEFHPDRFRQIDESYRTLTSLAFQVERIFAVQTDEPGMNLARMLADLPLAAEEHAVPASMQEIRTLLICQSLWPDRDRS